jgi:hypothetical protein
LVVVPTAGEFLLNFPCQNIALIFRMNRSTAQPVCCNGDNFNGAVVVGCTPISV